ncbi:hypothetical protein FEM48_Zijuj12G0168800 [Ziziphus jujuba var. spinosa]|uniref:Choline transporter-like protein n=1 Tax=Ziziphus jujuba var. spinosa TaxID=714518 RepID=A0A978UEI4_ZIZJJ|nr:hypothetical protein FEM48_Zijuj12G0168800 [Ziziphus jujuba var. spinosa]
MNCHFFEVPVFHIWTWFIEDMQEPQLRIRVPTSKLTMFFKYFFYLQCFLMVILTIYFGPYAIFSSGGHPFHRMKWFAPMLTSGGIAALLGFLWQWLIARKPATAVGMHFWLINCTPTWILGLLLIAMYTPGSLAAGILVLICGLIQSLYCCWITSRVNYAKRVLSAATSNPPAKLNAILIPTMLYSILYACLLVSGILGITATRKPVYRIIIPVILLSLVWTMTVIRIVILVTISGIKYIRYVRKSTVQTLPELWDYLDNSMGYICIASAVVPVLEFIRLTARMRLLARFNSEFLLSCANWYSSWAARMIMFGNRWGFVHVGVYSQAIKEASIDTLGQLRRAKMEVLILSDLTGPFCFLSAVAGGAICSLVGGIWTFAVEKSYATEITLYAFLIGYLMIQLAMAWPHACILAYYVAYSERPQHFQNDTTIPDRMEELQRENEEKKDEGSSAPPSTAPPTPSPQPHTS